MRRSRGALDSDDRRPAKPAPLVAPALIFAITIAAADHPSAAVAALLALAAIGVWLAAIWGDVRGRLLRVTAVLGLVAFAAWARFQTGTQLEGDHLARLVPDSGSILSRIEGVIVTRPDVAAGKRHNPFAPFAPETSTRFLVAADRLATISPPAPITGLVRVSVYGDAPPLRRGDRVTLTGKLWRPQPPRNPGAFDWRRWNRDQHVHVCMTIAGGDYITTAPVPPGTFARLLSSLQVAARAAVCGPEATADEDEIGSALDAMILGNRSAATQAINDAFLRTGAIHLLTVSGFHVGLLAFTTHVLLRWLLRRSQSIAALGTILVLLAYALLAEPNAPILRATTMGVLICIALATYRSASILNLLAFAALALLAFNPLELFRPGFQLSFLQVAALILFVPPIIRRITVPTDDTGLPRDADTYAAFVRRYVFTAFVATAVVSLIAWVVALPLVLFHFQRFAPWAPLQAVLITPLAMLTIVLGFLTLLLGWIPVLSGALSVMLAAVTGWLLHWVDLLGSLPASLVEMPAPPAWLALATYLALALLALIFRTYRPWLTSAVPPKPPIPEQSCDVPRQSWAPTAILVGMALAWIAWIAWLAVPPSRDADACELHILDVGNGSAALLCAPDGQTLLFDVGTMFNRDVGRIVADALRASGRRRIDAAFISHANLDHYSGLPSLLERVPIAQLYVNPFFTTRAAENPTVARLLRMLPATAPTPKMLSAGDALEFGDIAIEVLWPPANLDQTWAVNDRSFMLRVAAFGRSVVIPGDPERAALAGVLYDFADRTDELAADVLVAPHHGAVLPAITADFYHTFAPSIVVVSTARPLDRLRMLLSEAFPKPPPLFDTSEVGAITIRICRDGALSATSMLRASPTAPEDRAIDQR